MSNKGKTGKIGKVKDILSSGDVSNELGIPARTVRDLAKKRLLPLLTRYGDEGHYRFPREEIEKLKKVGVAAHPKLLAETSLREVAKWQRQLSHLEDIRQRGKNLEAELVFPPPQFVHVLDLSLKEMHLFSYPVVRWQQVPHGGYILRLSEEFNQVTEHLDSAGNIELLRKLQEWLQLGGECIDKCYCLQVSTRELARNRTNIWNELNTGQWTRGLYEGFWWTIYSGGFLEATDDLEYKKTSEKDSLCILSDLKGSTNLTCIYPDEVDTVSAIHRKLRRDQQQHPLVRGILKMTAEMDSLKKFLSDELAEFSKQEIIPGKCVGCLS